MTPEQVTAAERMLGLFSGRTDAYGAVEGRCVREPLTVELMVEHLFGEGSVGVYPLDPEVFDDSDIRNPGVLQVAWGATDIDRGDDMRVLAENIRKVFWRFGIRTFVERSKGKGYHVLVFMDRYVNAETMRNAFLLAHQVAGVPATEIYPKQTVLTGAGYGNYLNLPYAKKWVEEGRRVCYDDGDALTLEDFLFYAESSLTSVAALEKMAALYREPVRIAARSEITPYDGNLNSLVKRMSGLGWTIFTDGPLPTSDRSSTLAHLAFICHEDGFTTEEALAILTDADSRWGKFSNRPDGERHLKGLVSTAYGR